MSAACPICRRPVQKPYAPFCSGRCADVDLRRWLVGGYAIPAVDDEAGADDADDGPGRPGQGRGRPL